jgi:hypothetical protein
LTLSPPRVGWRAAGVADLLFSSQLRTLVEVLLGGPAWLYNEQYIVKPPSCDGAAFQWHRDSDVCAAGVQARPYLSVWCALDDVHEGGTTGADRGVRV